ncbi:MAG TPA: zinc ABC transporter substrate-binding protein, partial [Acidimicrobiales bacterium]|nr:zinc ABC transporter substrate-binding protein [Acidimicrobiales bacterium]
VDRYGLRECYVFSSDYPHVEGGRNPVPVFAAAADRVAASLAALRPEAAPRFARRARAYQATLAGLDGLYTRRLARCDRRVVVTAHSAFSYLAARYDLRQEAVTGISPEAEPESDRLDALAAIVGREKVTTVFTEPATSPRVARTLARETGARVETLSPLETLTAAQRAAGDDYVSVMRANLDRLTTALGCQA